MSVLVNFPRNSTKSKDSSKKQSFDIFGELSKRVGADLDKVIFEQDAEETRKMEKKLMKETMKKRTKYFT